MRSIRPGLRPAALGRTQMSRSSETDHCGQQGPRITGLPSVSRMKASMSIEMKPGSSARTFSVGLNARAAGPKGPYSAQRRRSSSTSPGAARAFRVAGALLPRCGGGVSRLHLRGSLCGASFGCLGSAGLAPRSPRRRGRAWKRPCDQPFITSSASPQSEARSGPRRRPESRTASRVRILPVSQLRRDHVALAGFRARRERRRETARRIDRVAVCRPSSTLRRGRAARADRRVAADRARDAVNVVVARSSWA